MEIKTVKDAFEKVECYTSNIAELAGQIDDEFVKDDGQFIEINFTSVIKLIQVFWDKVKETATECEGKTIKVKLPEGLVGSLLTATLSVIGFKL